MEFAFSGFARKSMIPSAVNELTASFALDFREGEDINLGVGYVNDKTIPVGAIKNAINCIAKDTIKFRSAFNYGGAEGAPNLTNAIKTYYTKTEIGGLKNSDFENKRIVIGANGATSILEAFSELFEPGIVITADPYYYIYTETLERKGFSICAVEEDENGIIPEKIETLLDEIDVKKISFFYIVTVNNPSTLILSNKRRQQIVELVNGLSEKLDRKIPVVFDKAYEDIIHDPTVPKPVSALKFDRINNVFELGTLSKILSPALRIGYLIGNNSVLFDLLIQKTSDIGFSASLFNQEIAGWLLDNYIEEQKTLVNKGYQQKARFVEKQIKEKLYDYIQAFFGGKAAFYYYLTFKKTETHKDSDFFKFLSRTTGNPEIDGYPVKNPRLIYIPGTICSKQEIAARQIRISYGFEEPETFSRAIDLIAQACSYAEMKYNY